MQQKKRTEKDIEDSVARFLTGMGYRVDRQAWCQAGRIDLMTHDSILEIETTLTRRKLFEAIGQVTIYRCAINPKLRAIVVGQASSERIDSIMRYAEDLGVEVWVWKDGEQ